MDDLNKPKKQSNWGIIFVGALICLILFSMAVQRVIEDEHAKLREEAIHLSETLEIRLHKASDIAIDTWLLHRNLKATMAEMKAFNREHLRAHPYVGAILHLMPSSWQQADYHPYGAADNMPVFMRHHTYSLDALPELPNREVLNAALMAAIDGGKEVYSEEAHLASGEQVFYLVHPFYHEPDLEDAEARRAALDTLVVALLRPSKLLGGVGHKQTDDFLYSGDTLLAGWRHDENVVAGWMLPHLSVRHSFHVLQREYRLEVAKPLYWGSLNLKLPILALILGVVISALLFALKRSYNARAAVLLDRNHEIRRQVARQTEELRRSKTELERQRFAVDQHAIVSIADAAGDITYVNDKFCEISGYERDELIGHNHRMLKSGRHSAEFFSEMWHTISHGDVWHDTVCNRNKRGEEYWVNSSIVPFLDDNGLPYQYVSIRTDITSSVLQAQQTDAQRSELDSIINTVPALIWYKDRDSNIVRANRAAAALAGISPEEMEGRPHTDFFPPELVARYRADDLKVLDSGEPLLEVHEIIGEGDEARHFRVDRVPHQGADGEIDGLIVMATDITHQERMERELFINEERLRRSQTFANIGTWDWNIQSGDLFWSDRIAPLFGYEVGALETTYENFLNAVHPDDREQVTAAVGACVESSVEYNIEHRVVWPDGQVRWLSEKGDVVRDADGKPLHMLGVVQDIHDRKMAEEALQESQDALNRFKSTLDQTEDCVFMFDAEALRFFYVNRGAVEQLGYSYDELIGMHPYDIKPDYGREEFRELIAPLLESGEGSITFETRHRDKAGDDLPVEISLQYIAPENEPPRFVAIVRDIRERKQMGELLARQRALLDMLREATSRFMTSSRFNETSNHMLKGLLELTGSEYGFTGEVLFDDAGLPYLKTHAITNIAWNDETREFYDSHVQEGLEFKNPDTLFGEVIKTGEYVISNEPQSDPRARGVPEGHPPLNAFLGVPIYYGRDMVGMYGLANREGGYDGEVLKLLEPFAATYGVIIHSKRMQQMQEENRLQMLEAKEEAVLANKAKSEFLSSMSHELRTPMNAILGFAQLLEDEENLTDEQRENVHDIVKGGHHLLDLINEVLDLSKIEAGKMELSIDTVSLDDILATVKKLITPLAEKRNIRLHMEPGCMAGHFVKADYTRAKQVLLNLASNAVKYNREDGGLFVDCQVRDNDMLRIEVRDTGHGIPADKMDGLFEAFNRLGAGSSEIEGTGIGLVITRQLVELMGGEMGVDSEVGLGSTFWFELPRAGAQAEAPVERSTAAAVTGTGTGNAESLGKGRRILYIEDNPINLKLVSKLIAKRSALEMLSAEEPVKGLEIAASERPDLILLDINLPGMSGYEVVRHLREMEATRDIPVIALSANAMDEDIEKGREAGFDDYLTKPIHVKSFLEMLERYLGSGA